MLILASASPRRRELLRLITEDFRVLPSDCDESPLEGLLPEELPEYLACKKAGSVQSGHEGDIVIGCDTGVFLDGKMLGKPTSSDDAFDMLRSLSGRTHRVITGCALLSRDKRVSFSQATEVTFYPLTDAEIRAYIATGEHSDKAGAYGIQGRGSLFVKEIRGDYFNVVGMPVARLKKELEALTK